MIRLKRVQLNQIYSILDTVKLNKIEDSVVRKLVLKIIIEGKNDVGAIQNEIATSRSKFFDGFPKEDLDIVQNNINTISSMLSEGKHKEAMELDAETYKQYKDIVEAYNTFQNTIREFEQEEIELNISPISLEQFVDAMVGQDLDITGGLLETLSPIFENEPEN